MSILFTARPTPSRWPRIAAVAFVLATVVGGLVDGIVGAGAAPPHDDAQDAIPGQVLVGFDASTNAADRTRTREALGATELSRIDTLDVHVWRVPERATDAAVQALRRNPNVHFAEADQVVELAEELVPDDEWYPAQWALPHVNGPRAWALTTGSSTVQIAVLDTGVSPVSELDDKLLPGWNVVDGSTDVTDTHGHGTLAAGVAAAETNNTSGVASIGFDTSIIPVKIMSSGSGAMSDLATGIVWAADHGAEVISMSVSGSSGGTTLQNAVRYAADHDVVLVAAAGNNGDTVPRYPAALSEVIGVAGTDSHDDLYSWSNHGDWVDVAAPGFNRSMTNYGEVSSFAGTSSATPVVAGIAGLAASTGASAAEIRQAIEENSVAHDQVRYGRVDAYATLLGLPETTSSPEPTAPSLTATIDASCVDLSCDMDGSTSADSQVVAYEWELGDGTTATGREVSHAYGQAGRFLVSLTVTDDDGGTAETSTHVEVTEPADDDPPATTDPMTSVSTTSGSTNDRGSWTAWVDVTVVVDGGPAAGSTVTADWVGDGKHGDSGTTECATAADGTCRVAVSQANRVGEVTFSIRTVAGDATATATKP